MAEYSLLIKRSAGREVEQLPTKKLRARVVARILDLARDPRPPGAMKLAGQDDRYRVRLGDLRVVYTSDDRSRTLTVVKVGHRKEVYR